MGPNKTKEFRQRFKEQNEAYLELSRRIRKEAARPPQPASRPKDGPVLIPRDEAKDVAKYRLARAEADKRGVELIIVG